MIALHGKEPAAGQVDSREGTQTVLLVDDDRENLRSLSAFFLSRGFRVRAFTEAQKALEALRGGLEPALVITDYRMPGMDGLSFIESFRRMRSGVPLIMLTAHGDIETYFRSFSLGVFEYIHKPVSDAELERVVTVALRRTSPNRGSAENKNSAERR